MHRDVLAAVSVGPASGYAHEKREILLATSIEELAGLRFSILVTAKWERAASEDGDVECRDELRADLACLRRQYSAKIDELAMTFGVESAMKAKDEVERMVVVPQTMTFRPGAG